MKISEFLLSDEFIKMVVIINLICNSINIFELKKRISELEDDFYIL